MHAMSYAGWGWFTLTELQERLNIADRGNLRANTVGRGAPHVCIGREIVFAESSFADWLRGREAAKTPAELAV